MESTVTKFANFIGKSADIEIPYTTLHSAKLIVADCLGAIVGGMAEPEIRMLAESKGENPFEILDCNKKATDESISFLFGTAGTVLERPSWHACFSSAFGGSKKQRMFGGRIFKGFYNWIRCWGQNRFGF